MHSPSQSHNRNPLFVHAANCFNVGGIKNICRRSLAYLGLGAGAVATALMPTAGRCAEEVRLHYSIFSVTVDVEDLETLAETGEARPLLETYLNLGGQSPASARQLLNRPVEINANLLNTALAGPWGDALLGRFSHAISPSQDPSNYRHQGLRGDDRQWAIAALREAAKTSVKDDNQLTLLEFIQNYPADTMHVRVERIQEIQRDAAAIQRQASEVQDNVENLGDRLRQTVDRVLY
ncbi:MAG: alpha/beta hydrolase [Cyanobacteria bacterium P01_F01_bin.153]